MYHRARKSATILPSLQETVAVLDMPTTDLNSPCPSPSRKRRKTSRFTAAISKGPVRAADQHPATVPVEHALAEGGDSIANSSVHARKLGWLSFTICVCECDLDHTGYTTVLPQSVVATYTDFLIMTEELARCDARLGVYTDLEGNDLLLRDNYLDYIAGGLSGVIWHRNFYSGVTPGDKISAQRRIKECLSYSKCGSVSESQCYTKVRSPGAEYSEPFLPNSDSVVTPPPRKVGAASTMSPSPIPYTIRTSSSGQVTELRSCDHSESCIRSERLPNIFTNEVSDDESDF